MRNPTRVVVGLLVALAALFAAPQPAAACMCIAGERLSEHWRTSEAVFHGRVLSIEGPRFTQIGNIGRMEPPYHSEVRFEVLRAWKGVRSGEATIADTASNCRYGFEVGKEYLVWAGPSDGISLTSMCSPNVPLKPAAQEWQNQWASEQLEFLDRWPGPAPLPLVPIPALASTAAAVGVWARLVRRASRRLPAPHWPVLALGVVLMGVPPLLAFLVANILPPNFKVPAEAVPWGLTLGIAAVAAGWLLAVGALRPAGSFRRGFVFALALYVLIGLGWTASVNLYLGEYDLLSYPNHLALPMWPWWVAQAILSGRLGF